MDDLEALNGIAASFGQERKVTTGKWFGLPCLKVEGKVFAALWEGDMAFKLAGKAHAAALQVKGALLFDPRGQGQPMKAWVQIPAAQSSVWLPFAKLACDIVQGAAQAAKEEIIQGLVEARRNILSAARSLSTPAHDEAFLGEWSVKELLAHLVGWDHTNLTAVQEILAGQKPGFWAHYDRDWQSYNARLVAEYRRDDLAELVALAEASHQKLIDFLQTVAADAYVKKRHITTLLRAEISDEEEHHEQVQAFRRGCL